MKAFKWIWASLMILCLLCALLFLWQRQANPVSVSRRKWICRRCRKSTGV